MLRRFCIAGLALALALPFPANAARPLLDYHRLDAYFALYARDSSVPWKPASVRLETYTSAPVSFSVYEADVADVISAGSNTRPRSIDTRRRTAIARWTYTPPGGYRFQSNDVAVPIGSREGFFVVEARRGGVGEQVWINRTRVGLLSKETPSSLLVYGADLGTGKSLAHMRVSFIVGSRFIDRFTDAQGLVRWQGAQRPVFALAQWGASNAFISFLPQAPLPRTIVGVRTDSAVVHAGEVVHVVGFVRTRSGARLRAASGNVSVILRSSHGVTAQTGAHLDAAGAFDAALEIARSSPAGDYTIVASANGASSATALHVDANAGDLSISVVPQCEALCDPNADVPILIRAKRSAQPAAGASVHVSVVRSPHAYANETVQMPWGIAPWYSADVTTDGEGRALFTIPRAQDGLASTFGVRASSGGATADTRLVVPTSHTVLQLRLASDDVGNGTPAAFNVSAWSFVTGKPVAGSVRVQLVHGASIQQQTVVLDERGNARGAFTSPPVGSNLIIASYDGDAATDASQLRVEPQTMQTAQGARAEHVAVNVDRQTYVGGDDVHVRASLAGASGNALLAIESPAGTDVRVVAVSNGDADARFHLTDASGTLSASAAFVRDGSLQWDAVPLNVDAPGRPVDAAVQLDRRSYEPGALTHVHLAGVRAGSGTMIVRITKNAPSGSAQFISAPDVLAVGTTATQDTASAGAAWHPWVDSSGDHPLVQTFARRTDPPPDLTMAQAETQNVYWHVERRAGDAVDFPAPAAPGHYVISVLKISDDGRVLAASSDLLVR